MPFSGEYPLPVVMETVRNLILMKSVEIFELKELVVCRCNGRRKDVVEEWDKFLNIIKAKNLKWD